MTPIQFQGLLLELPAFPKHTGQFQEMQYLALKRGKLTNAFSFFKREKTHKILEKWNGSYSNHNISVSKMQFGITQKWQDSF